ncbi:MAG: hypothetical protein H6736_05790 [Alphaproteobacteria bacterium]|nr:hypothetical protein [Alphaproteobacteria bacterium]MCB9691312.1 hypothetical protein [Alphaproteobacteria bacterium]
MWNPDDVLASLAAPRPDGPHPDGAPVRDVLRSPAAARVGALAAADGLFLFHFEHRYPLDVPAGWVLPGQEDAAEAPRWDDGVLPEPKYQSFRHDLMIGGFHPGHRGKWSTHELCHGLVGFAWRAGAPRLFHATAGRLAELLPVVLYYFLDEIGLARCPVHAGGGPLFREHCPACEEAAATRPITRDDRRFAEDAGRFLDAELAAVARTRREGRPVPHRFGSLDLCSDGLAYAESHHLRLGSEAMERLEPFLVEGGGWSADLDALEARVVAVARALALGEPLAPLVPSAAAGRDRWIRQDLAFRLLTVREECEGSTAASLEALVDQLREGPIDAVIAGYTALEQEVVLPPPEAMFGVGYPLGAHGRSHAQVAEGLRSVCPLVMELAEDVGVDLTGFDDPPVREPLGDRFARWMREHHPALAPLAEFETAVRAAREDPLRVRLGEEGADPVLCSGTRVLRADHDVLAAAEAIEKGSVGGHLVDDRLELSPAPPGAPWALVVGRFEGELVMLEVDPADADVLLDGGVPDVAPALLAHGVMRPSVFPL